MSDCLEVTLKISKIRELMLKHNVKGIRLKGVDWFFWLTGGGSSSVILTSEMGVAEIAITFEKALVITNRIEKNRLREEELPSEFEVISFPWADKVAPECYLSELLNGEHFYSDRPANGEKNLPQEFLILKMTLLPQEVIRYREVGRLAAEAMTDALLLAKPSWTELELAAEGARALLRRGLDPTLILVGGEQRAKKFRHPIPTKQTLGKSAMMVFCARGYGLYANLTRFIFFEEPSKDERQKFAKLAEIEAQALKASVPGEKLSTVYKILEKAYSAHGEKEQIQLHHQGGPTGYLSREAIADPSTDLVLEKCMALAWNPSLEGAKIEDTVLISDNNLEILTVDQRWPTITVEGRKRPDLQVIR